MGAQQRLASAAAGLGVAVALDRATSPAAAAASHDEPAVLQLDDFEDRASLAKIWEHARPAGWVF